MSSDNYNVVNFKANSIVKSIWILRNAEIDSSRHA